MSVKLSHDSSQQKLPRKFAARGAKAIFRHVSKLLALSCIHEQSSSHPPPILVPSSSHPVILLSSSCHPSIILLPSSSDPPLILLSFCSHSPLVLLSFSSHSPLQCLLYVSICRTFRCERLHLILVAACGHSFHHEFLVWTGFEQSISRL